MDEIYLVSALKEELMLSRRGIVTLTADLFILAIIVHLHKGLSFSAHLNFLVQNFPKLVD